MLPKNNKYVVGIIGEQYVWAKEKLYVLNVGMSN